MHSRFDDGQTEHFVAKLNKSLRWTPARIRTELHAELRQHLEALAAAHEELGSSPEEAYDLALRQFGDPAKIGRKLWWEWFRGTKPSVGPACQAAVHILAVYTFAELAYFVPLLFAPFGLPPPRSMEPVIRSVLIVTMFLFTVGIPLAAGFWAGRKFPGHAVKAALWISLAPMVWILPSLGLCMTLGQDKPWVMGGGMALAALFSSIGAFFGEKTSHGRQKITHRR